YAYAPLQTDVGDPWCAFVSYGEGWVDGVYLEADWDEFLAKLDRGGLTVAMIDGVSAEISGNPNGMSGWDGYGYVYYRDFAEARGRPFIQVLWYPSDPPRE